MKIGILGTHGVGKTTLATKFFSYCTERSKNVRIIHEVVRDCPFGLHDNQSVDTVSWITTKQIGLELDAKAKGADIIICDRTSIDPMMYLYAKVGVNIDAYAQSLSEMAHSWLGTYDTLIFVRPTNREIVPDGFRDVNKSFQNAVDLEFSISIAEYTEKYPTDRIIELDSYDVFTTDLNGIFNSILNKDEAIEC